MTELNPLVLEGMSNIITLMEQYRALLEGVGFSRWAAEAMTIRYHDNLCAQMDRQAAATLEATLAAQKSQGPQCTCAPTPEKIGTPHEDECPCSDKANTERRRLLEAAGR